MFNSGCRRLACRTSERSSISDSLPSLLLCFFPSPVGGWFFLFLLLFAIARTSAASSRTFGMPAFTCVAHALLLRVSALFTTVIVSSRPRTFASRMLALIFGLNLRHRVFTS